MKRQLSRNLPYRSDCLVHLIQRAVHLLLDRLHSHYQAQAPRYYRASTTPHHRGSVRSHGVARRRSQAAWHLGRRQQTLDSSSLRHRMASHLRSWHEDRHSRRAANDGDGDG